MGEQAFGAIPPGTIPYVVGVTGHRDLVEEDEPALRGVVSDLIGRMRRMMPSTPIVVLSALADGADQLAAEVAIECGALLGIVLPMPVDVYREQMSVPGREVFDRLSTKASVTFHVDQAATPDVLARYSDARVAQYGLLARFIAGHCHALIALWDGNESSGTGGTAEVVDAFMSGGGRARARGASCGVLYHVVTRRTRHTQPVSDVNTVRVSGRYAGVRPGFDALTERLNRFASRRGGHDSRGSLCGAGGAVEGAWPFLQALDHAWANADALSMRLKRWRSAVLLMVMAAILGAAVCLETHTNLFPESAWLWLAFPMCIGTAFLINLIARRAGVANGFLDFRALAEALRVQYFWELAGVHEDVWENYPEDMPTEPGWVVPAMRGLSLLRHPGPPVKPDPDRLLVVRDRWVRDQMEYFASRAGRGHKSLARLETVGNVVLAGMVFLSAAVGFILLTKFSWLDGARTFLAAGGPGHLIHWLIPVASAAVGVYKIWIEQNGHDEQVRNFRRMADVFAHRLESLQTRLAAGDLDGSLREIHDLGVKALGESTLWLVMHRERPIRVQHGG